MNTLLGFAWPTTSMMLIRSAAIVVALGIWFATQWLLSRRTTAALPDGMTISDGVHTLTARWNQALLDSPKLANALLVSSSLVIDLLGLFVLTISVIGPTTQPFIALLMVFILRQLCQFCSPLPPPMGMIWRDPGVPSILVTYGTTTDFFFSGHTSLAVLGAMCLGSTFGPIGIALGVAIALFEITTVLILRAHYTMDVFTGLVTALYVYHIAGQVAPQVDRWLTMMV